MPEFSTEFVVGTAVAVISALLALGSTLAMDAKTKGEFRFAVTCFLVSALTMVYGIVEWDMKTNWPTLPRILIVYGIVAFVVLITGETIRWANGRHTHAAASQSGPTGTTPTSKYTDKGDKDTSMADGKSAVAEQPKPKPIPSTEPADRANLHVIGVKFETPDIDKLESFSELQSELFVMAEMAIPRPKASILIKNIGKYRVSNFMIRTAIILSEPLAPGEEEDKLFAPRPEWQSGGTVGLGNIWYPGDEKIIHTTWNQKFQQSDWAELVAGNKVFYIVTKSTFRDQIGSLPVTESCRWVSLKDQKQTSGLCLAHNT